MKNTNMHYFKRKSTKILLSIITLCICGICIQSATAIEYNTTTNEYKYFAEIAGRDIATHQAKNWSDDAQLIRITVPNSTLVEREGKLDFYSTEFSYIYRSSDKYFDVLINLDEYEKGSSRTEEISRKDAEKLGFNKKTPLSDWKVTNQNAFNIALNSYNTLNSYNKMSLNRGDVIDCIYLETAEINETTIPVWNIYIKSGMTGMSTNYSINAETGDILYPKSNNEVSNAQTVFRYDKFGTVTVHDSVLSELQSLQSGISSGEYFIDFSTKDVQNNPTNRQHSANSMIIGIIIGVVAGTLTSILRFIR